MTERPTLDRIFDPRSIAVVGASAEPAKRGYQILRALSESGYSGHVFPVNPRGGEILQRPVVTAVEELPEGVDLAVLCTPAAMAPDLVRGCGARGVAGVMVLAVGYGESGAEGHALEARLVTAAREASVRLIGPNTSGLLNMPSGVNLVGARGVRPGGLALLVQSGNMALALMTEATERSWEGISAYVGVGNQCDVGFAEALHYLCTHDPTRAVILHAEGFRDAGAFIASAALTARTKPIVAIKSGRTARGAEAALSHTGAVTGPYARLSAALAQAGVVEVNRADELLHVAETLANQPVPAAGSGIVLLSDGGGQGALAVDTLTEAGAPLATLSATTRDRLRALLGPAAAVANPVDVAGAADARPEAFGEAVEILVADAAVGSVLVVGLFGGYGIRFADTLTDGEIRAATAMAAAARAAGCGLVVHSMYALHRSKPLATLGAEGVPVVASLEAACRCLESLHARSRWLERPAWGYTPPARRATEGAIDAAQDRRAPPAAIARARDEGRGALTEPEARDLLSSFGLPFAEGVVVDSADAVVETVERFRTPVAVKLVSAVLTHKSDVGGVELGVEGAAGARAAYEAIDQRTRTELIRHGFEDTGGVSVLVTPMEEAPRVELLVGAVRDPELGPVLTVGAGGIWVDALEDVSTRILPVLDHDVAEMLRELRLWKTTGASRGRPAVDVGPVVSAVNAVAEVIARCAEIAEVEVNPLFVYEDGVVPIDARVVLVEAGTPPAARMAGASRLRSNPTE